MQINIKKDDQHSLYILGWCELFGNVTLAFELRKHVHQILYLETRFLTLL